jgi:Cys-tRNA synthase (O-phospho-L-seryl-tRNA:Cys-tRNA synthase)
VTAAARTGGLPILGALSTPARAFLLGTVAVSLVAIILDFVIGAGDTALFVVAAVGILGLAWTVGLSTAVSFFEFQQPV